MDDIDTNCIDHVVLTLLHLKPHDDGRTWMSFDWDAMNHLHEKGFITDPIGKAKSVMVTAAGQPRAEELFHELFTRAI
ncbi:DUF6429 family protein [Nitrospirillum iridis]|uniref:DUF6429 domain-containing protein n=1 Tax=Nitrospirillum iridis TaxID=765888 RepID=A0A7X0EC32_9PROT|nr:DUF6429 family protein [Nitrospirillum iridis]MBB6250725.1 hypothetical protein [Nitrospirillum iridis]